MITRDPVIYQADWLSTADGPALSRGWLRVEGNRIAAVGAEDTLPSAPSDPVHYLEGCTLMPGLVNAHCHLELTSFESLLEPGKAFPDWVKDLQGAAAGITPSRYRAAAEDGIRRLLRGGTTTVLDVGNTGEALQALAESPLRAFACIEVLGLDPANAATRFEGARARIESSPSSSRFHPGLAAHAPYSGSPALLRSVMEYQTSQNLPITIHAAESREEAELFASASGPMQEFCSRIFPAAPRHTGTTPIRWLESEALLPQGVLIIHGNTLDEEDMKILARREAVVVHCPSSHAFFGHPPFPYAELRARGIPVCLGTDSLASGNSLSMLDQMRLFRENFPEVPTEEARALATVVAAEAMGIGNRVGKLKAGYRADFIAVKPGKGRVEKVVANGAEISLP